MDIDLNIDNYSFDDFLSLFKLSYDFTTPDLKNAKKIVLKMHPDKSKLDKEYFLFFSKAYKILVHINEFRNKSSKNKSNTDYSEIIDEEDSCKKEIISKLNDRRKFNIFFNEMFEKMKTTDDEQVTGYADWLKGENENSLEATSVSSMHSNFEKLKSDKREMVVHKEIEDVVDSISSGSQMLSGNAPESYTNTKLFDRNSYIDVKEAYDNPVIPVTNNDYTSKKKYASIQELQIDRKNNEHFSNDILQNQAKMYFTNKKKVEDEEGNRTAFKLIQQEEVSRKNDEVFWGHLKLLDDRK